MGGGEEAGYAPIVDGTVGSPVLRLAVATRKRESTCSRSAAGRSAGSNYREQLQDAPAGATMEGAKLKNPVKAKGQVKTAHERRTHATLRSSCGAPPATSGVRAACKRCPKGGECCSFGGASSGRNAPRRRGVARRMAPSQDGWDGAGGAGGEGPDKKGRTRRAGREGHEEKSRKRKAGRERPEEEGLEEEGRKRKGRKRKRTSRLSGSSQAAKRRLSTVYSCPQKSSAPSGRPAMRVLRFMSMSLELPWKNAPTPPMNTVSPARARVAVSCRAAGIAHPAP